MDKEGQATGYRFTICYKSQSAMIDGIQRIEVPRYLYSFFTNSITLPHKVWIELLSTTFFELENNLILVLSTFRASFNV